VSPFEFTLVLTSAFLHAVWSVSIKGSGDPVVFNVLQKVAPLAALIAILPLIEPGEIPDRVWWLLALTGPAHGLYFYWLSCALEHGDLTLVYPIARSTPALLPLAAVPLLGESISPGGGLGIAIVVAGIWLVHAGAGLRWRALGGPAAAFAYGALAAGVVYSLVDKTAMAELASTPWTSPVPRAVFFYLLLMNASAVFFVPLALRRCGPRAVAASARSMLGPATIATLVGFLGYGLILKALETAPASYVVTVRQTSVLFAIVLGALRLRERPGRPRILGATATVVGVALIGWFGGG